MNTGLDNTLPGTIDALKRLVLSQQETLQNNQHQLTQKQARIQFLEEQVFLFKHCQFGKSSEKSVLQVELFDEVEAHAELTAPDSVVPLKLRLINPHPN
jgi:hypothetical protein